MLVWVDQVSVCYLGYSTQRHRPVVGPFDLQIIASTWIHTQLPFQHRQATTFNQRLRASSISSCGVGWNTLSLSLSLHDLCQSTNRHALGADLNSQLLMFPPWLLHSVLPSNYLPPEGAAGQHSDAADAANNERQRQQQQQLRVSWAFNLMATKGAPPPRGGHDAGVTDGVNKMSAAVHVSGGDVMESAQEDLLDALLDEL